MSSEQRELWERQPKESSPAFQAWTIYRDLGPNERSTAEVSRRLHKQKNLMDRWSSRHGWVARAQAYDDHIDEQRRHQSEEAILRMLERQATETEAMQRAALEPTRVLLKRIQDGSLGLDTMAAYDLLRLAQRGMLAYRSASGSERVARGLPERGPLEVTVTDEGAGEMADALRRLADLLEVEPEAVVDEIARRRSLKRVAGE